MASKNVSYFPFVKKKKVGLIYFKNMIVSGIIRLYFKSRGEVI